MALPRLAGGFQDPATDAARAFRVALNAMARPGQCLKIDGVAPPAPLSVAAGALLLTLIDHESPVALLGAYDDPALRQWLSFHTGAAFVGPAQAAFAVGRWADLLPLEAYPQGVPEYPERSATLIVESDALVAAGSRLTGPGIQSEVFFALPAPAVLAGNAARFPLGLDFYFTAGDQVAGLPRSTRIEEVACTSR